MQNLLLTLAAAVIGAFVLFSNAAISWRTTHASDSAAQYAAAKSSLQDFVDIVERDVSNMGSGLTNKTLLGTSAAGASYRGGFTTNPWDTLSTTRHVEFCSVANPADIESKAMKPEANWGTGVSGTSPSTGGCDVIRYEWTQTGTVTVRDEATSAHDYETIPVYTLDRYVTPAGGGAKTLDGGSLDVLTQVSFTFLNRSGARVAPSNARDVRSVRVAIQAVSPLGGGRGYTSAEDPALAYDMDRTRWSRTIRPPNLARVDASH